MTQLIIPPTFISLPMAQANHGIECIARTFDFIERQQAFRNMKGTKRIIRFHGDGKAKKINGITKLAVEFECTSKGKMKTKIERSMQNQKSEIISCRIKVSRIERFIAASIDKLQPSIIKTRHGHKIRLPIHYIDAMPSNDIGPHLWRSA
ncbi:hypothetical protein VL15_14840 [Burkholderia cepacia]|uniref:Uncharacterized protein n=1 Tax=Burkholderia cepacia TaxID=292 RepID=A0A0J5WQN7_BURCE|nr:hypothetical protein VL15_14840 [Burkholderia cepacia]